MSKAARVTASGLFIAAIGVVCWATPQTSRAQILTTPNYGQQQRYFSRPDGFGYDARLLPPSPPRSATGYATRATRIPPQAARYAPPAYAPRVSQSPHYPASNMPTSYRRTPVRESSYRQANYLPPPPGRVYRGQEPADLRPRLNDPPSRMEEYAPAPYPQRDYQVAPCRGYSPGIPISSSRPYIPPYRVQYPQSGPTSAPANAYRPLLPLTPMPTRYYFGQGSLGQPKVYVPGQPLRNFIRYITL